MACGSFGRQGSPEHRRRSTHDNRASQLLQRGVRLTLLLGLIAEPPLRRSMAVQILHVEPTLAVGQSANPTYLNLRTAPTDAGSCH